MLIKIRNNMSLSMINRTVWESIAVKLKINFDWVCKWIFYRRTVKRLHLPWVLQLISNLSFWRVQNCKNEAVFSESTYPSISQCWGNDDIFQEHKRLSNLFRLFQTLWPHCLMKICIYQKYEWKIIKID